MITNIIRHHTVINYMMSTTRERFRPYWVSSGGCKKHSIIKMLKKNKCVLGCKKDAIEDNVIQQYLYYRSLNYGHK